MDSIGLRTAELRRVNEPRRSSQQAQPKESLFEDLSCGAKVKLTLARLLLLPEFEFEWHQKQTKPLESLTSWLVQSYANCHFVCGKLE